MPPGFAGRILGTNLATYISTAVFGNDALAIIVGVDVLFAVSLTVFCLTFPISKHTLSIAGGVGGVMGALTGIGAPSMAILYSKVEARRSTATQNAFYGLGTVISIVALSVAGFLTLPQLAFVASLAPLVPQALRTSRPLAARFERGAIRPCALGLAKMSELA